MAGFDGPVAVGRVDIGMAYSTGLDLDDDFTWSRCWFREVFDYEWFVERVNDGCFHLLSPSHWGGTSESIGDANSLFSTPQSALRAITPPAHRVCWRGFPRD